MKFFYAGLGNWANDLPSIKEQIITADKLGFHGALLPDHYMWDAQEWLRRPDRNITLDTWVTFSYLAGLTEQIRLGTLVTPVPLRPPGILAKMISTLDVLSNGRVVLGIGAGWSQSEFEGYSEWNEPKTRVDKVREGVNLMIKLWTKEKVTFNGKFYEAKGAVLEPKPVQKPYPPLLFGGSGNRMLKLAGEYADLCYIPRFSPEVNLEEKKELVMNAAKASNRPSRVSFILGDLMAMTSYNSKEYIEKIEAAKATGADYYLVTFAGTENKVKLLNQFAEEVMPSFK